MKNLLTTSPSPTTTIIKSNNKKISELNNLLMSQLETNSNNLTNLRDVLKAAHKINLIQENTSQQHHQQDSLASLIEILKLDTQNELKTSTSKSLAEQPQFIINKIEKDLQESLKLLKQYNENLDNLQDESEEDCGIESSFKQMEEILFSKKSSGKKYSKINEEDDTFDYNFNRNDLIRKNVFSKSTKNRQDVDVICCENNSKMIDLEQENEKAKNISTPCMRKQNKLNINLNQRRNSIDQISLSTGKPTSASSISKSSTSTFNYEKFCDDFKSSNTASGFWNYDELNELKMKFISLLSESNSNSNSDKVNKNLVETRPNIIKEKENLDVYCLIDRSNNNANNCCNSSNQNRLSSMSFVSVDLKPISSQEQLKIESFYRSFGTSLFIAQTCASLFTIANSKINSQIEQENQNRISIATTTSIKFAAEPSLNYSEISQDILRDIMQNKHQNYASVYHRGVPLWLFNSGKNPRRPVRQLKFTLAEKGTGFILWQDRIDAHSDFNLYLMKKNENTVHNISSHFDNLSLINEIKQEQLEAMLVTFRASDKKTTVFLRFDINSETIKFYDYYKRLIKNIIVDIKQRTKSLPIGVGNANSNGKSKKQSKHDINLTNKFKSAQNGASINFYNYDYNLFENNSSSSPNKNKHKRQSYQISTELPSPVKLKKITKNDISNPCNYKHIINLKSNDKNSYYTLSKLLPACLSSTSSSNASTSVTNEATPSPTFSILSSSNSSSPRSSYLQTQQLLSNCTTVEYLNEHSKSINQSTSCSSNSSLSTISPPVIKITNNSNKFFGNCSFNHKQSKQKTVK